MGGVGLPSTSAVSMPQAASVSPAVFLSRGPTPEAAFAVAVRGRRGRPEAGATEHGMVGWCDTTRHIWCQEVPRRLWRPRDDRIWVVPRGPSPPLAAAG